MRRSYPLLLSLVFAAIAFGFASSHPAEAAISDWYRGASIQPFSMTDFKSDLMKKSLDSLKSFGANYVTLVIPYYQADRQSTEMRPGWNTPSDEALAFAADYAHSIGLRVMFKPHLETDYIEWRGNIDPAQGDRPAWFASYTAMLERYGRLAEAHGVEDFCIGAELIHLTNPAYGRGNTGSWKTMIATVRQIYHGKLTYSANRDNEVDVIEFWPQLDYIGLSAYYDLYHAQNNSVPELKKSWDSWRTGVIEPLQKQFHMPIVFTEVGYRSHTEAYRNPWDWSRSGTYSEIDQANAYEALFSYWKDYPWMKGVQLWRWEIDPPGASFGDTEYTPQNKLAQRALKNWWGGYVVQSPAQIQTQTQPQVQTQTQTQIQTTQAQVSPARGASWSVSAVVSPSNPTPGTSVVLTVSVTNISNVSAPQSVVDLEIYDAAGGKVSQSFFPGQSFGGREIKTFTISWSASRPGRYVLKAGIFSADWTVSYYWTDNAGQFTVVDSVSSPVASNQAADSRPGALEVWWPMERKIVRGVQPFKAMLQNSSVFSYDLFWQVDGDRLNPMFNSTAEYPHKEAIVDLFGWSWKGTGPYALNFVAKDKGGSMLGQKQVNIYVAQ